MQKSPHKLRYLAKQTKLTGSLYLYDSIGKDFFGNGIKAKQVADSLEEFKQAGVDKLNIYINSPGGSVFDGVAIYNSIARYPGSKTIHIDGIAASIASLIAMSGDRIRMGASAMIMVHEPHGFVSGEAADMRKQAEVLDSIREVMLDTYVKRTKQQRTDLSEWISAETWMDSLTALNRGFADEIAGDEARDKYLQNRARSNASPPVFHALAQFKNMPSAAIELLKQPLPLPNGESEMAEDNQQVATNMAPEHIPLPNKPDDTNTLRISELLSITGKTNVNDALASVAALKMQAEEFRAMHEKINRLENERKETQIKELLDQAVRDTKLTPAKRLELDIKRASNEAPFFLTDPTALKALLDYLPKNLVPIATPPPEGKQVVITPEMERVARQLNLKPQDVAARMYDKE